MTALVEAGNIIGNGVVPGTFLKLSKTPTKRVKIAQFTGETVSEKAVVPKQAEELIQKKGTKGIYEEEELLILGQIPQPVYSESFLSFMEKAKSWIEKNIDEIGDQYFHVEIPREEIQTNKLAAKFYTDEARDYFKYLENEKFTELYTVADIISGHTAKKASDGFEVKTIDASLFNYPLDYSNLKVSHPTRQVNYLKKGDLIVSTIISDRMPRLYLIYEEPRENISVSYGCFIIRPKMISPEYLYLYLQSETAEKYIFYNNPFLQLNISVLRELPVSIPTEKMEIVSKFTFDAMHPISGHMQLETVNELLREDPYIPVQERPFQSIMLEELLNNVKMEKRNLIEDLISSDSREIQECFDAGAYKACLIICGSILETVLLDWLSEIENTNYFIDDQNMQINLYGVIRRLKEIYNPDWNDKARKAHDVRLKRNLVHPVKYITEQPEVSREICLHVFEELREILLSRGIETDLSIDS